MLVRVGQEVQEVPRRLAVGGADAQRPPTPDHAWARPPSLSDGVVRLEPLEARFGPELAGVVLDPDIVRFTRLPTRPGEGFVEGWLSRYERGWEDGSRAGFAIVADDGNDDGALLGFMALIRIDWDALEAEVGYLLAPAARGRGLAGRALELLSRWALDALGLVRLEAWIDTENGASLRVAERAGYTREGVRRSTHFKAGRRVDMAIYSLLAGELA